MLVAQPRGQSVWHVVRLFIGAFLLSVALFWLPGTAQAFISGTLYRDAGVTTAPSGVSLRVVVSTSTNSVYSLTTSAGGTWSLTGVATTNLSSSTPIVVFIDASSTDATTLVSGFGGANITGVPLYYNTVIAHGTSSLATVDLSRFTAYDNDNDNDIQFVTAVGATSTTFFADLVVNQGVFRASPTSTVLTSSFTNNATFDDNGGMLRLVGASKTLSGTLVGTSALGNVVMPGSYTMVSNASTTDLVIEAGGALVAPTGILTISGYYGNRGTFTNSGGTVSVSNSSVEIEVSAFLRGLDSATSAIQAMVASGTKLYAGKYGNNNTCSNTVQDGCELLVFDISSTTNPVYVAGQQGGAATTTFAAGIYSLALSGNTLFAGKYGSSEACSNTIRNGCELMVFNISSTTNPVYVAGQQGAGTSDTGSAIVNSIALSGTTLYVGKYANTGTCSNTDRTGCELMVFNISSTTNPVYVAGTDTVTNVNDIKLSGSVVYVGKTANAGTCSNTDRTGCELIVFNISSTTNPVYVGGADSFGNTFNELALVGTIIYAARGSTVGTCSDTDPTGCELQIFDISSTTNPVYVGGREGGPAWSNFTSVDALHVSGNRLFLGTRDNTGTCSLTDDTGCELVVLDISSTTNPVYLGGQDTGNNWTYVITQNASALYVAVASGAETCSAAVRTGCELFVFDVTANPASGLLFGALTDTSALHDVRVSGRAVFTANASATDVYIDSGTTTLPAEFSVNSFSNQAVLDARALETFSLTGDYTNTGLVSFDADTTLVFLGDTQTLSGDLTQSSRLRDVVFAGNGSKTFLTNATATDVRIENGVTVHAPPALTITGDFDNSGTFDAGENLELKSYISEFLVGLDAGLGTSSTEINYILRHNNLLYVAKGGSSDTCSNTNPTGCELMVVDVSSSTRPVYVAGQQGADAAHTTTASARQLLISSTTLYLAKAGNNGTCSTTVRTGCELMVFNISSTTNPVYVGGQDSTTGAGTNNFNDLLLFGTSLYVGKAGNNGTCSTTVRTGCELMVFDVSSSTNPVYVGGQQGAGTADTTTALINTFALSSTSLFVAKAGNGGTCSNTDRTGCELMVFNISSTTNPVYVGGQDGTTGAGTNAVNALVIASSTLYVGRGANTGTCSNTDRTGCELMVFNISSTTNPVYVGGQDAVVASVWGLALSRSTLYVAQTTNNGDLCSDVVRDGCEFLTFDVSSSTNPQFVAGQDVVGNTGPIAIYDDILYLVKSTNSTDCSVGASPTGCELVLYNVAAAEVSGALTGTSALGNVDVSGNVSFVSSASTTSLVNDGIILAPSHLSVTATFTNNGTFMANSGTVHLSGADQGLLSTGTTTFYNLRKRVTSPATLVVSAGGGYVVTGTTTLTGTGNNFLTLRSTASGTPFVIDAQAGRDFQRLNVKDGYNANTVAISCAGCVDAGNNTNWEFIAAILEVLLSGTLYTDTGTTPAPAGVSIVAVIGTSTPSVASTVTASGGTWTFLSDAFDTSSVATTTGIAIFIDASSTDATTLVSGFGGDRITGIPLYYGHVVSYGSSTNSVVDLGSFTLYDRDNDTDILFVTATSGTSTTIFGDFINERGTLKAKADSTVLMGSFTNNATFDDNGGTLRLAGTSEALAGTFTGASDLGFVRVAGSYTAPALASSTSFLVEEGASFTAASNILSVNNSFVNFGSLGNNGGTVSITGTDGELARLISARESGAGTDGNLIYTFRTVGTILYAGRTQYTGTCVAATGEFCELLIYDVSSTTNPVLLGGRESGVGAGGAMIRAFEIIGDTLYAVRDPYTGTCTTTTGEFCEILIYNISSTTNPVLLGGRESGLTSAGGVTQSLLSVGSTLYVGRAGYAGTCVAATGEFCELLIYDVSSTTNPVLLGGRESGSASNGSTVNALTVSGSTLYVGRVANVFLCTPGTAAGCELLIYDISSTTNPVYVNARESGVSTGGGDINTMLFMGSVMYMGRANYTGTCTTTTGEFCELLIYDVSSTTNPVLLGGRETGAGSGGNSTITFTTRETTLYVGRVSYPGTCVPATGEFCELLIYDIATTTNPVFLGGQETGPGSGGGNAYTTTILGSTLYVGRDYNPGICVPTTGEFCELMLYSFDRPGLLGGLLVGANALNNVRLTGQVRFPASASTSAVTIGSGTTTVTGTHISASNGMTNSGVFDATRLRELTVSSGNYVNNGTSLYGGSNTILRFTGTTQSLSGTLVGSSALPNVSFLGSGSKTIANLATTSSLTIGSGVTLNAPTTLTVTDDFTNNGTFNDGSLLEIETHISSFLAGREVGTGSGGGAFLAFAIVGNTLYLGRDVYGSTCVQTSGDACEILIYNISSTTNPVLLGGRESGTGSGGNTAYSMQVVGSTLYVGRTTYTGTCTTTSGNACEILIYNISSTTNPVLLGGRESGLTSNGGQVNTLTTTGSILYVGRSTYTGTCTTTTGEFCELLIYDISSTTNPVLLGGRESGLTSNGNVIETVVLVGTSTLYVGRAGYTGACTTTTGAGCELLIYDISSTTNPVLLGGRESGLTSNGGTINTFTIKDATLYVGRTAHGTGCVVTTGDSCELLIYNISSTTNPVLLGGRESGLGSSGANTIITETFGSSLYVGRTTYADICNPASGVGCELYVYDIASTTNPVFAAGREINPTYAGGGVYGVIVVDPTTLYATTLDTTGTCVPATGEFCELVIYNLSGDLTGTLTGTSALGNVTVSGNARFVDNASTTNLTVSGTVVAPAHLSIEGSYTQSGIFTNNSGTVYMSGTSQQTATGTLSGTSAFNNLTLRNTFGNGTTSQAVVFGAPVETTGTFTMGASTSARFLANATNTFEAVNWTGATGSPVWLRSSATGTQWRFTSDTLVTSSYANVRDSFNGSVATATCSVGCTDAGNNTRWDFSTATQPVVGTLTLTSHPADQASNLFSFQNQSDGLFYRFSLTAATETAIVDDVVLSVFGLRGVDGSEVTDLRLYRDVNSDGALDGGDTQVLGAGIFAIDGEAGTITFSTGTTSVATTSAQRYIVTADTVAIDNNDWMNVQLRTTGVTATGLTSGSPTTIAGSVTGVQHIRSNAGGGGANRSPIGGDGPPGAGIQVGGGSGGGGNNAETGQLPEGANITPDPDFFRPTTNGSPHNEWTGGANAYASDGVYATAASQNLRQTYGGFGLNIPGSNTIQGVQVKLDGSGTTAAGTIQVALSWDGGTTITTLEATPTLSGSDIVYTLGGQTNLWGRTWTATELNDTNFRLRVVAQPSSNTVRLDGIEVRVYHTAGGGGLGGGAGGGAI